MGSEPFSLPPEAVANLTEHQLAAMLKVRNKDSFRERGKSMSPRDVFHEWAKNNKIPDWLEEKLWQENPNKSGVIPPIENAK